jgi:hypothetical protein
MDSHPRQAAVIADSAMAEASREMLSCRGQRDGRVVVTG